MTNRSHSFGVALLTLSEFHYAVTLLTSLMHWTLLIIAWQRETIFLLTAGHSRLTVRYSSEPTVHCYFLRLAPPKTTVIGSQKHRHSRAIYNGCNQTFL